MTKAPPINPFENRIVSEPRKIEKPVADLNVFALKRLINRFDTLVNVPLPRQKTIDCAAFVVSVQPGYGKSHLIGRFFQELAEKATVVYLRPFQDPDTSWNSILQKTIRELKHTEHTADPDVSSPKQMEQLAHGILVHLLINALKKGDILSKFGKEKMIEKLQKTTVKAFSQEKFFQWVQRNLNELENHFLACLEDNEIFLHASPKTWIRVMFTYAYFPRKKRLREVCLDWMRGGFIEREDAKEIGVNRNDIPHWEAGTGEMNELCCRRLQDLCRISGFFRPFVFCFDQNENFGKDKTLATEFGYVIETLIATCPNHMTVVTANQMSWKDTVEVHWEIAHRDRLCRPPDELEGINRKQGWELVRHRLISCNVPEDYIETFRNGTWMTNVFNSRNEIGVRDFITECAKYWNKFQNKIPPWDLNQPCVPEEASTDNKDGKQPHENDIKDAFKERKNKIRYNSKLLEFQHDPLYWVIHDIASRHDGMVVKKHREKKSRFFLKMTFGDQARYFGFEAGSHHLRWKAIAGEAQNRFTTENGAESVLFRTPEQTGIPKKTWKVVAPLIEDAAKTCLHIIYLTEDETAELYAAFELFMDATAGDIPFSPETIKPFLQKRLSPFFDRIRTPAAKKKPPENPPAPSPEPTEKLVRKAVAIVRKGKFLSFDEVKQKLNEKVPDQTIRDALSSHPQIRIHATAKMTVYRWRS